MMAKVTHTPGPWLVGQRQSNGTIRVYSKPARNMSELGKTLAFVSAPVVPAKKGESEAAYQARRSAIEEANARLIAAGPELLEHVKLLARTIEYQIRVASKNGDDEGARLQSFTLHLVRETLEKAGA